ncbi:MAG: hypothetical protein L0099_17250 [Acidobacteria bacterium]|nr:hypothetical protein [Acidobacteriota bacterium]
MAIVENGRLARRAPAELVFALALALMLAATGCSMSVDEKTDGKDKKVEIKTPVGELKVRSNEDVDVKDIGLPEYPGARRAQDRDDSGVHASITSALFGLKVVFAEFESDDAPQKVLAFYRPHLEKYGKVTECHGNVDFRDKNGMREIHCKQDSDHRDHTELVVGSSERFRVLGVEPRGKGSKIGMAFISLRGGRETM